MVHIKNKMREHQIQWFGHVLRQGQEDLVRAILECCWEDVAQTGRQKVVRIGGTLVEDRKVWKAEIGGLDAAPGEI